MNYRIMLLFQKVIYLNVYLSTTWICVTGFFLYHKVNVLEHLTRYLALTVYTLLVPIETARLYLGYCGNISCRVPELAGFLMLTVLMQFPLVSFFLFNPYLISTPTEYTLHAVLWTMSLFESMFAYLALKNASFYAKTIYISNFKER